MKNAVILLSGGLDSATVAAIARHEGFEIYCLSLDYGQRHRAELAAAARVAGAVGAKEHRVVKLDLTVFGGSALTDKNIPVPVSPGGRGIPITYVPARNTIMLSLALAWAEVIAADHIFLGVNAVDYSGYPDCRPEYLKAFEAMANLATKSAIEGNKLEIRAPIVTYSKADIIRKGVELGVDYALTVSCYQARDVDGAACGHCDACCFRRAGFETAGVRDPTLYQA